LNKVANNEVINGLLGEADVINSFTEKRPVGSKYADLCR